MSNNESEFKNFSGNEQGWKEEFEKLKKKLKYADSNRDIDSIKRKICNKTDDEIVKKVLCEGKTYKDAKNRPQKRRLEINIYIIKI